MNASASRNNLSLRDIGALLDHITLNMQDQLDAKRIAVMGGSCTYLEPSTSDKHAHSSNLNTGRRGLYDFCEHTFMAILITDDSNLSRLQQ